MKKLAVSSLGALVLNLLLVAPALAQPPGSNNNGPHVGGEVINPPVIHPQGGTAFTGADIAVWMVLVAALVVLGVALLVIGRRRRAIAE